MRLFALCRKASGCITFKAFKEGWTVICHVGTFPYVSHLHLASTENVMIDYVRQHLEHR